MKEKKGFGGFWKKLSGSRELSLVAVLVLLCAVIQLRNNTFLTAKTIADLLKNYSTTITISLGMMSVLLIGGIDISVGATLAFSGMCASLMMRDGVYSSTLVMFLVSIAIGTLCGMLVGLIIAKGGVQQAVIGRGVVRRFQRGIVACVGGGGRQLGRRALHDPAAAGLIKADDPLALLDVATGEQKACFIVHPALLVQHDGEICRTQDAGGAVDVVEAVLGVLALAGVVHQQHADAPAVGKGLQPAHVVVVGIVGIFKGLCLGLDLG